jgi:hypothetical protein
LQFPHNRELLTPLHVFAHGKLNGEMGETTMRALRRAQTTLVILGMSMALTAAASQNHGAEKTSPSSDELAQNKRDTKALAAAGWEYLGTRKGAEFYRQSERDLAISKKAFSKRSEAESFCRSLGLELANVDHILQIVMSGAGDADPFLVQSLSFAFNSKTSGVWTWLSDSDLVEAKKSTQGHAQPDLILFFDGGGMSSEFHAFSVLNRVKLDGFRRSPYDQSRSTDLKDLPKLNRGTNDLKLPAVCSGKVVSPKKT